jgi:hypothetical protein
MKNIFAYTENAYPPGYISVNHIDNVEGLEFSIRTSQSTQVGILQIPYEQIDALIIALQNEKVTRNIITVNG